MPRNAAAPNPDDAAAELRRHGLRATPQRLAVLGALMDRAGDATAQGLHDELQRSHPGIGLATVYRTLGALADAGVIDAMQHGHGTCYRRCAPGHHHHLTCTRCHRVVELHDCEVGDWAERMAAASGFQQVEHRVELSGICGPCARG